MCKGVKSQLQLNRFLHNIGHLNYANLNSQKQL